MARWLTRGGRRPSAVSAGAGSGREVEVDAEGVGIGAVEVRGALEGLEGITGANGVGVGSPSAVKSDEMY